jgi:AAA+ ATPase superfamily predicted ATPase
MEGAMKIIGREKEQKLLEQCIESKYPEFIAVYGRRRVGKTFLIREYFHDNFAFHLTGISGEAMSTQLGYFDIAMKKYGNRDYAPASDWHVAFTNLIEMLGKTKNTECGKKIVFIDELAWLDTKRSGFLSALEHFWNSWGAGRPDLVLIICGSASSWMTKKIFKSRGGFHNRITKRIRLAPFSLKECHAFLLDHNIDYDPGSLSEAYMVFGGIPYYFSLFQRGLSVSQSIDEMCFAENAPLENEFTELYRSLFSNADRYITLVRILNTKRKGLSRDEIIRAAGLSSGGTLTDILDDLEQSGFITSYEDFSRTHDRFLYRLTDLFTCFYLEYMGRHKQRNINFWANHRDEGSALVWRGYAFETLCMLHIRQIKYALSIAGVSAKVSTWRDPSPKSNMQIDLIFDRKDGILDLLEMKYTNNEFVVDKAYADKLIERKNAFAQQTNTRKTIHLILVTSFGLKKNNYSHSFDHVITLEDIVR